MNIHERYELRHDAPDHETKVGNIELLHPEMPGYSVCIGFRHRGGSESDPACYSFDHARYWRSDDSSVRLTRAEAKRILSDIDPALSVETMLATYVDLLRPQVNRERAAPVVPSPVSPPLTASPPSLRLGLGFAGDL